ncbi:MAG: HD domain-containing protein, partial [Thermodesulfobacteriota bacterium]|nr:HD domain-containing protein [Thermodesulfobacteriota bacterium]
MPERSATFNLDFYNLIETLSGALDLVGGRNNGHGKIVAYIALTLAEGLGLPPEELDDLRTAALLHNAGVSRTSVHEQMRRLDWDKASQYSCEGAELLKVFSPFARPAKIILHQRVRWDRLAASDTEPGVARPANLVFLADRINTLLDRDREL